eukprot:s470_g6.t1
MQRQREREKTCAAMIVMDGHVAWFDSGRHSLKPSLHHFSCSGLWLVASGTCPVGHTSRRSPRVAMPAAV